MKTVYVNWNEKEVAAKALLEGKVVLFPTETVYGIAVIAGNQEAFDALVRAKGRPADKPFSLMCSSLTQAVKKCEVNAGISAAMKRYMPGEVTFLLSSRPGISKTIDLGTGTTGVRVPDEEHVRALIDLVGAPLLVSSANISGQPPVRDYEEAKRVFDGVADVIVEGTCRSNKPSTIVDFSTKQPRVLREGSVNGNDIIATFREGKATIALGSDHGGFLYKESIKKHLLERGYQVHDFGCSSIASVDYPLYGKAVAESITKGEAELGIVVCTSGEGISIAANKVKGARCGIGYDDECVGKMREHNNANIIAFGQKYMKEEDVLRRVDIFLTENFSLEAKHHRRVDQLEK